MIVILREATSNDLELVLAWRNNPLIWQGLYQQSRENRPLTWEEHYNWWHSRYNWKTFIIQLNDNITTRDIGYISISQLDYWSPEIGLSIGETTLWGRGIGKQALTLGTQWVREKGYKYTSTTILDNNERSKALFLSLGYERIAGARPEESLYRKKL